MQKIDPRIEKHSPETGKVIEKLKELEYQGYQFEGADGAFELLIRKILGKYKPLFELENFKIIGEHSVNSSVPTATAAIKIKVGDAYEITAAEGQGPVNALDKALRKALEVFYLIESSDGVDSWTTVGVSKDIIEASWIALVDSIEYKLIKDIETKFRDYL